MAYVTTGMITHTTPISLFNLHYVRVESVQLYIVLPSPVSTLTNSHSKAAKLGTTQSLIILKNLYLNHSESLVTKLP